MTSSVTGQRTHSSMSAVTFPLDDLESRATEQLRPDLASGEAMTSSVTERRTHSSMSAVTFPLDGLASRATEPLPTRPCVGRSKDFLGYRAADALVNVCGNLPA
jgi:hypothetical protein